MKPVLLIDIDGVLNALGIFSDEYEATAFEAVFIGNERYTLHVPNGTRDRIRRLIEVFDPVWCTAWQHHAHATFTHHLACGCKHEDCVNRLDAEWPHIAFEGWGGMLDATCNWKWPWVMEWAKQTKRPWAWIDDDFREQDLELAYRVSREAGVPTKILKIPAAKGLGEEHAEELLAWAERTKVEA